jgi:enoyl-CoA hydratase/carnithine racemase
MTDEPVVLVERRDRVGIATMNRPAKLNAMNSQLVVELEAALRGFDEDEGIGAIVITGAGERAFSAGGDMKEQVDQLAEGTIGERRSATAVVRTIGKPIVAAIRGYCFGGGALLAINCDIRIAAADARFKFHSAGYGQVGGGAILPRIVGVARAKELLYTGDEVDAAEAERIGLVNRVVGPAEVLETAVALAGRIAANSPQAVAALQRVIDLALPYEQAQAEEDAANRAIRAGSDSADRFRRAAARVVGPA